MNPGNTLPVTEHPLDNKTSLKGKPFVPGYQSHYTVVPKKNTSEAFPLTGNEVIDPTRHADELVVFQDAQALPLFIIYT